MRMFLFLNLIEKKISFFFSPHETLTNYSPYPVGVENEHAQPDSEVIEETSGQNSQVNESRRLQGGSVVEAAAGNTPGSNASSSGSHDTGM